MHLLISDIFAGFANLDAICTGKSQSVAEDHFNFLSITILTHELGHRYINYSKRAITFQTLQK